MRPTGQSSIRLVSVLVLLFTLSAVVVAPAYARGPGRRPPRRLMQTSASVINDVPLTPGWWNGDQCDSTHYDNDSADNPHHLQAAPLGAFAYRGEFACGPMPLQTGVDVPVNFYTTPSAPTEDEWECTELVKRYLYQAFGVPDLGGTNGNQVVDNYSYQNSLLKKYQNNSTPNVYPVAGDVLSFAEVKVGDGGHTAIVYLSNVDANGNGILSILDQNNTNDPLGTGTLYVGNPNNFDPLNPAWHIDTQPGVGAVTGWLHPNTLVPIQTPTLAPPPGSHLLQPPPPPPGTVSDPLTAVSSDTPPPGDVSAEAIDDVWAVGQFQTPQTHLNTLVEHWNGTSWVYIPTPNPGTGDHYLTGVKAFSPTNVWVVGYSLDDSSSGTGIPQTIIEHTTNGGKTWTPITQGPGFLYAIDGASPDDLWAVGIAVGGSDLALTLHFTNNTWTSVANGTSQGTQLLGISARTTSDVWAVGSLGPNAFSMHWDGTTWTIESVPSLGPNGGQLNGVVDLAANDVWAVGDGGQSASLAIHWNGTSWDPPNPFTPGIESGLSSIGAITSSAFSAPHLWAVGFVYDGTSLAGLIEESSDDGHTWQQISNPTFATGLAAVTINPQNGNVWIVGDNVGPTLQQGGSEFFN